MKRFFLLCLHVFLFVTVSLDASKVAVKAVGITVNDMERSINFKTFPIKNYRWKKERYFKTLMDIGSCCRINLLENVCVK